MTKSIFIALLITLSAFDALAQVPGFGRCPQTTVVQNFDVPRYLGRWFEIRSYPAIFQLGGTCTEANYGLRPDGVVSVLNKSIRLGQPISVEGTATLASPGQGKLIVNFPQSPETTEPNYFILGTDYDSFAVVHSCSQVTRFTNVQFAWVLSRTRTMSRATTREVNLILSANGVSRSPFSDTRQTNCN